DDGNDQAQEDHQSDVEEYPQHVVPDRARRGKSAQVDEALVVEKIDVVVQADPIAEIAVAAAIEAQEERVDRRDQQEYDKQDRRRSEEKPNGKARATTAPFGVWWLDHDSHGSGGGHCSSLRR